ncbi:MAG TPA: DNA-processing protein DprA [Flavobacteriales bacterium]|nr:DNA-processing protein DprA [Flavobacteriales bacterium]
MKTDFDKIQHIIGLTLIEGVGHVLAKRMIAYCGGPKEVFAENANKLLLVPGVGDFVARMVRNSKTVLERAEYEIGFCIKNNIDIHTYLDDKYPHRLKNCEDGPCFIFAKGTGDLNAQHMVNIIGTREPSPYGKEFTEQLVAALAPHGLTIVSGMAYGIDITAHRACLKNNVPTIGVVAHGLDRIYPESHTVTAKKMLAQGAILSEFLTGNKPDKENFPKRNRVVAGMCDATIVIETGIKGGSMITARLANDYNRDVFALPGKPNDEKAVGCNFMIKTNRAHLFENARDIAEIMGWPAIGEKKPLTQTSMFIEYTEEEKRLTEVLKTKGKMMVDLISLELALPVSKVSVTLLNLEFKGAVRSLPGKVYELV